MLKFFFMETKDKLKYLNREISWMYFNDRVLQEASDATVPLFERLRFLGIFSNNLDEFFRVRVAALIRMADMKLEIPASKQSPTTTLKKIEKIAREAYVAQEEILKNITEALKNEKIFLKNENELSDEQLKYVRDYYNRSIADEITPYILNDNSKIFSQLRDAHIYFLVKMGNASKQQKIQYALLEMPVYGFERFVVLPDSDGEKQLIFIDDIVRLFLPQIFGNFDFDTFDAYSFKITRDSEMEIESEMDKGFMEKISKGVKSRRFGLPLRFIYDRQMPDDMRQYILKKIEFKKSGSIVAAGRYHNFKDLMDFPIFDRPDLIYPKNIGIEKKAVNSHKSILRAIEEQDISLHYPYYSFSHYVRFLREAAIDPEVKAIKITLYRVAKLSKVARMLINAAKNGKQVEAVVELLARFDEEHNIQWAQRMEEAGVKVVFGVEGLKIHSKLTLIKKKNGKKLAAISTGNFHEGNAAVYTDFTLLTADSGITKEVDAVFDFIDRPFQTVQFHHLIVSPQTMRKKIIQMINMEIVNARKNLPAFIHLKLNHLTDPKVIEKLYEAAQAGVKIKAAVRGMCSLVSKQDKLKGNMEVVGVVDRFLEHSRIFIFCNNGLEKYFVSSADWMTRNLDNRIEVAAPVYDKAIQQELRTILDYAFRDNVKARICDGSGRNKVKEDGDAPFRSQQELKKYYMKIEDLGEDMESR